MVKIGLILFFEYLLSKEKIFCFLILNFYLLDNFEINFVCKFLYRVLV